MEVLTGKSDSVQNRKGGESKMCPLYIQSKESPKESPTLNRSKMKRTAWQVCKNITGNKKNIKKNLSMQKTKKKNPFSLRLCALESDCLNVNPRSAIKKKWVDFVQVTKYLCALIPQSIKW